MAVELAAVLQRHPWPASLRDTGVEWMWHWRFEVDAPPDVLWPHLSDTSRFNRALGLGRMQFEERDGALHGDGRNGFVRQQWIEEPWQWVAERELASIRVYARGLAYGSRVVYALAPNGRGGSELHVHFTWLPRGWYGRLALALGMRWLRRQYARATARLARELREASPHDRLLPAAAPPLDDAARARLDTLREQLYGAPVSRAVVDRLVDHVSTGDELELYRIRVVPLARRWGVDDGELLVACLYATRVGLLELSWDVVCPHCRGVRFEARSLGDVPVREACEACDVQFAIDADRALEITFHVHPSIRAVPKVFYCSAEPATKPHILVQQTVPAGQTRTVPTSLAAGRYRIRVRGRDGHRFLDVVAGGPAAVTWRASDGGDLRGGPGCELVLINDRDADARFVVESAGEDDDAVRPSRVFNLQDFRDLFSEQYLAADLQLSVGEQTILFTDMVGSTEFYGSRGDPDAFMEVKRHFTEVYAIVRRHRGCVVKTIGDAAMAAFSRPADAVAAAREVALRFGPHRTDTAIRLRVSINTGPCIAVNLNSGIDYFGGTVNMASKLQAKAGAGEVAIAAATCEAPGVRALLDELGAELEPDCLEHPALPAPLRLVRWKVAPAP